MSKPGPNKNTPPADLVDRITREEAEKFGASHLDVLCGSRKAVARAARTAAIQRIIAATGCSHGGLEKVWGGALAKIDRRFRERRQAEDLHRFRLNWLYGPALAATIIAGLDPWTNADVERWRRLGEGGRGERLG